MSSGRPKSATASDNESRYFSLRSGVSFSWSSSSTPTRRRAGLAPTGNRRLGAAHNFRTLRSTKSGQLQGSRECSSTGESVRIVIWPAVVTVALTQRGLFTRESESFGAVLWGPVVNPAFTTDSQSLSLEPEKISQERGTAETLCHRPITRKPRGLSLSGFVVNHSVADSLRVLSGS